VQDLHFAQRPGDLIRELLRVCVEDHSLAVIPFNPAEPRAAGVGACGEVRDAHVDPVVLCDVAEPVAEECGGGPVPVWVKPTKRRALHLRTSQRKAAAGKNSVLRTPVWRGRTLPGTLPQTQG